MVPSPDSAPRDRDHSPGWGRREPGTRRLFLASSVLAAASLARQCLVDTLALGVSAHLLFLAGPGKVSLEACKWSEKQIRHY